MAMSPCTVFIYRKTARFQNSLVSESATRATPETRENSCVTNVLNFTQVPSKKLLTFASRRESPFCEITEYGRLENARVCRVGFEYRKYSAVEEAKGQE